MNEPLESRWTRMWRVINSWSLTLDPDPWEPMHSRIRRLEEAVFARKSAATPTSAVGPPMPDSPAPHLAAAWRNGSLKVTAAESDEQGAKV